MNMAQHLESPETAFLEELRDVRNLVASYPADWVPDPPRLDTMGDKWQKGCCSASEQLHQQRNARSVRRKHSPILSHRTCGRTIIPAPEMVRPKMVVNEMGGYFGGLVSCDNQFCPDCMGRFRTARRERIHAGLRGAREAGHESYFVTLTTARASDGQAQIEAHAKAWRRFTRAIKYRLAKVGAKMHYVRALDTTFQPFERDVFHNHFHFVAVVQGHVLDFAGLMGEQWKRAAQKGDLKVSMDAQDIQAVTDMTEGEVAAYGAKFWSMGKELANFQQKSGKKSWNGAMSYGWMELMGLCHAGIPEAIATYRAHLLATAGKKTMVFSNGWKDLEELAPDIEEEEEETEESKEPFSISIPFAWWGPIAPLRDDLLITAHWLFCTKPKKLVFLENLWIHDYEFECDDGEELGLEQMLIDAEAGPTPERMALLKNWLVLHYPHHLR